MNTITPKTQVVLVLLFGALIGIAYGFGMYLFPAIAPIMIEEFGFTYGAMGITTGLVQAGFLVFALAGGFLTVSFGPFPVISGSLFLCALSLGGLALAPSFIVASGYLIVLGGCAASIWVPMVEVSQRFIDKRYQGRALGFMSSGTSYGVFANSVLIDSLLVDSNWRDILTATFIISGCFVVGAVMFFIHLRKRPSANQPEIKPPDIKSPVVPGYSWHRVAQKLASILNRDTAVILLLMFFAGVSCMPYQAYITSFLVDEHGVSMHQSAVTWRVIGLTGMVSGFMMGWVADIITTRRALFCVCVALSASTLILLTGELGPWQITVAALLFGLSFYAIYGIIPAYISHLYSGGRAALVFSFGSVVLGVGGVLGNVAGGFIKEVSGTFFWAYGIILLAACLAAALTFLMRGDDVRR